MALRTIIVEVSKVTGEEIASFTMPKEDEYGQPYTKADVTVLADHKATRIGYSGAIRVRVR